MVFIVILVLWFIACLLAFCYFTILLRRNEQVNTYRRELLQMISSKARDEINNGRLYDWERYYDCFKSVDYDTMLNQFWKPLDSFYNHVDWETGTMNHMPRTSKLIKEMQ